MAPASEAPGALETVRAFVNTLDIEDAVDQLESPRTLGAWLAERGLLDPGARPTQRDLEEVVAVRESLRALLTANNGAELDPTAFPTLNAAAERSRLRAHFGPDGSASLTPRATGVAGAVGQILGIVHAAMADGTWKRLKACPDDGCRWAFYDHSRNSSGRWCSMAVCGNRNKGHAFRERRRAAAPE